MDRLTKEQIEQIRLSADSGYAPDDDDWNALCDMALQSLSIESVRSEALSGNNLERAIMQAASQAGIRPNDRVRFIVDYDNGVDPVGPCDAVMSFCEHLLAMLQSPARVAEGEQLSVRDKLVADLIATKSPKKELAMKISDELVNRFLNWPLPDSVCSDECVTKRDWGKAQGWPKRVGTNLLTADEARQMLEYVFQDVHSTELRK